MRRPDIDSKPARLRAGRSGADSYQHETSNSIYSIPILRQLLKYYFYLSFLCLVISCQQESTTSDSTTPIKTPPKDVLFQLISSEQTNIDFQNKLEEGLNTNVLLYEYFYNGGGIAAADFNGDDLIDIYFTSNMGGNKFYLNEGNLKFKEVTAIAKVGGRPGPWKTGVTHVDINGDGKLDLYVCYSGALPADKRTNQLFINTGNNAENIPIFEEKGAEYGLHSSAFSNQGYFFDYDKDGDLDMLLLNHNPKSLPVLNEVQTAKTLKIPDPERGLRLFQQANGRFQDITEKAGISGSALSYGLGLGIADFNKDGWPDFYVSNDYTIPDYFYLNNGNGTFTDKLDESIGHTSQFSMGNDVADINNDGLADVLTLDMLPEDNRRQKLLVAPDNYAKFDLNIRSGFHHQYMRNMLQLNNGNGTFSEIGQLAGIDKTDWSWSALLADYDNDGWKDLYVTNGYHRDYTNMDFIKYMDDFVASKGRLKREDVMELINNIPSSDVGNYVYKNKDGLSFENTTTDWGMQQISNSNGAVYADLDNDGDLEIIVNNINKPAFIYKNTSSEKSKNYLQIVLKGAEKNTQGIGTTVTISLGDKQQQLAQSPARGYLSTVSPVLNFGLGTTEMVDVVEVIWPSGKQETLTNVKANQRLVIEEKNAKRSNETPNKITTIFKEITAPIAHENQALKIRDFDRQPLLINGLSHQGPCLAKGDLNGDGIADVFVGGTSGQAPEIYFGNNNGAFKKTNFSKVIPQDAFHEDTDVAIFDANGDGALDIYAASGGYHNFQPFEPALQDRLYMNDGKGNFTKAKNALRIAPSGTGTIAVGDVNGDSFLDVFVGGSIVPGRYPTTFDSGLLINDGKGNFTNQIEKIAPKLINLGNITDAVWVDINQDEKVDLVVIGEWLPVSIFINNNGQLENQTNKYLAKAYNGWWNTIAIADLNKDGQVDFIIGNQGTNTPFQVSEQEPATLVYKDFDKNGSLDPFFNYYKQGKAYPDVMRDELLGQLAHLRSKYTSFDSYADATMETIFSKEDLLNAKRSTLNHQETSVFLSTNTGKYELASLPIQAQYAPIHAIQVLDYDKDGNLDILLAGNNSHQKLRMGKSDANYGLLLKGKGDGQFEYISQTKSGLSIKGDVQSIIQLDNQLLFGINEGKIKSYKLN